MEELLKMSKARLACRILDAACRCEKPFAMLSVIAKYKSLKRFPPRGLKLLVETGRYGCVALVAPHVLKPILRGVIKHCDPSCMVRSEMLLKALFSAGVTVADIFSSLDCYEFGCLGGCRGDGNVCVPWAKALKCESLVRALVSCQLLENLQVLLSKTPDEHRHLVMQGLQTLVASRPRTLLSLDSDDLCGVLESCDRHTLVLSGVLATNYCPAVLRKLMQLGLVEPGDFEPSYLARAFCDPALLELLQHIPGIDWTHSHRGAQTLRHLVFLCARGVDPQTVTLEPHFSPEMADFLLEWGVSITRREAGRCSGKLAEWCVLNTSKILF